MRVRLVFMVLMAFMLVACGAGTGTGAQPLPTVALGNATADSAAATLPAPQASGGGVTASGVVVPMRDAQLAFPMAGTVAKVNVVAGDQVKAGDVLAELDNSSFQMQVDQAQRTLRELTSPAAIAAAELAVVDAQKALDDAQNTSDSYKYKRASQEQLENAQANLALAQDKADEAFKVYQQFKNHPPEDPRRAQAYTTYYAAVKARDSAQSNLNWLRGGPSDEDKARAQANLDGALAAMQEVNWYLAELKGETVPADATGAQLAQLQGARDALAAAQDQLQRTRLLAPIQGAVTSVNFVPGEYVLPGQVVMGLSDVLDLQVETTDLSERDVPQVSVGQEVSVQVKALNQQITGHVVSISPVATSLGGDVVYKTTIALDSLPEGLRSGMTVTVLYGP